ncbi:uncharacterized protein [Haliotis cracherodii]|uniref:uncharacterized protein n=1 Tax=Haliotis cracherodii TaxID=6455 RepID=UPI0039E8719A
MGTTRMMFELVATSDLPTNYMAVMKVDSVLDCTHECMREATCEAITFTTILLMCYLYQGCIEAEPSATANLELLIYNFKRGPGCNGTIISLPGPGYRVCPIGRGFTYEPTLNVCYKRFYSIQDADKDVCAQEGGSDLLKIDTEEKQDFFKLLVPAGDFTYIRGDRIPSTGQWAYWDEGTARPMPFIDWSPGQPNGETSGQDCLALDSGGQMDTTCHYCKYFLCEYHM